MGGVMPHSPIDRLADLRQLAVEFEFSRALDVAHFVAAHDFQLAVVAPLVGIPNLVGHGVQLVQRLLLGRGRHPGQALDVLLHRASISFTIFSACCLASGLKYFST